MLFQHDPTVAVSIGAKPADAEDAAGRAELHAQQRERVIASLLLTAARDKPTHGRSA